MQQSNKKLVSLVLCFTYIICSFPYSIIFVKSSATTTLTRGQITEIVEKYISIVGSNRYWNANIQSTAILKEQVDAGDYLSSTTTHACSVSGNHIRNNGCTSNNFTGVSRGMAQCWGFGDYMEYVIFKTTDGSDWTKTYSVDSNYQFKPGDLIHTTKGSTSQHIVVVYKVVDSHVYIIEANWGGKCHINTRELVDAYTYVNASNSYVMTPPSYLRIDTPTLFGTESINLGTNIYAKIKNRATGKYITNVENGDSTNSLIGQNADEGLDQIWKFETVGENLYKISSMKDNWVLDVNNLDTENGTPLEVYPTYNGTGNQQFYIFQKYDGYYIMAKHSEKMIDMALDTLKMATWDSGNYQFAPQEFELEFLDSVPPTLFGTESINLGSNFYAKVKNRATGKYITNVENGASTNSLIGQNADEGLDQIWKFETVGEKLYKISSMKDNWVLDVNNLDTENGTPLEVYPTYNGTGNQQFYIFQKYDGYYIMAKHSGKMIDMALDTLKMATWDSGNYQFAPQEFELEFLDSVPPTLFGTESINLGSNFYAKVKNRATGKYITNIENGASTNSLIGQNADEGLDQIWKFETVGEKLYKITSMKDNWVLDVNNLDTENGTPLEVYPTYNGTGNQQFYIFQKYDGYYIMAKHSGKMIDMALDTLKMATWDSGNYQFAPQEFDIIKLNDHTWKWIEDSPATCTETGKKHQYCTVCGMIQNADTIIPTEKHTWGEGIIAIPATCLSDGIESYTCSVCGKTKETILAKTPHIDNNGDGRCDECGTVFEVSQHDSNCVCGQYHTGPFAKFIIFFHRIIDLFRNQFKFA